MFSYHVNALARGIVDSEALLRYRRTNQERIFSRIKYLKRMRFHSSERGFSFLSEIKYFLH